MTEPSTLAQLRDIHLPAPIGFWPLAWGWYLLILSALFIMVLVFYSVSRHRKKYRFRRQALAELQKLEQNFQHHEQAYPAVMGCSQLLRRVSLTLYPRTQVASLTAIAWLQFLDQQGHTQAFSCGPGQLLQQAIYQKDNIDGDIGALFNITRSWIKRQPCRPKGGSLLA